MAKKKILFIIGSPNQTSQMHQISSFLKDDYDCWFSQFYPDYGFEKFYLSTGKLEHTIMAGEFKKKADKYLADNGLQSDYRGERNRYDMTVFCNDLIVPRNLRKAKTVWVQEGMIDKVTTWSKIVRASRFIPRYFALGTSLNGSSNLCDIYCVGSEGYRNFFTKMGSDPNKMITTGIINFDNVKQFENNDFPHRDYVMVATSDSRETYGSDNRMAFLKNCVKIAGGRKLLFKLHPNEAFDRAVAEIKSVAPADSLIFTDGNSNHMVANSCELITQWSTLVYLGIVLGKPVHSYFDIEELKRLTPMQNGGTTAERVAEICGGYMEFNGEGTEFVKQFKSSLNLGKLNLNPALN